MLENYAACYEDGLHATNSTSRIAAAFTIKESYPMAPLTQRQAFTEMLRMGLVRLPEPEREIERKNNQ